VHRLVTRQRRAAAAREQPEPVVETGGYALDPERGDARRRQLAGERDPVERTPNGDWRGRRARVGYVLWLGRARARAEQPDRAMLQHVLDVVIVFRRDGERWHPVDVLV